MNRRSCLRSIAVTLVAAGLVADQPNVIELACQGPLRISKTRVNQSEVALYDKFEITFDLRGRWSNPFDPTQIKVDAEFISPGGAVFLVPGFFYQEYEQITRDGKEAYKPVGESEWKIRFAPTEVGKYTYQIMAENGGQVVRTTEATFTATADTARHGFLQVSKINPRYFQYQDGTPFFAIGNSKYWDKIGEIENFYTEFARAGGNMTRNWVSRISEMVDPPAPRPDRGFGKIDLDRAWRHDQVIELCERLGIHQQLALANFTYLTNVEKWRMCVYNKANGGPLESREDRLQYLTNPAARENFRRGLRYFIARWAYSTAVFSWNLWNEVDLLPNYDPELVKKWHHEMGRYLMETDWAGHVIHTNFGTVNGDPRIDVPEMDMVSVNAYALMDFAPAAEEWTRRNLATYGKAVMLGEFGIGHIYDEERYAAHDPKLIMAHNGMWSTMMSGSAGTGMPMEQKWLDNRHYYRYVAAVNGFTERIPFCQRTWQPVMIESFRFLETDRPQYYADVFVDGWGANYRWPRDWNETEVFEITPDGRLRNRDSFPRALMTKAGDGCQSKRNCTKSDVTFQMDYPKDGEFVVFVPELKWDAGNSAAPQLTARLDGRVVLREDLAEAAGQPRWCYRQFGFPVSSGPHTIRIESTGGGGFIVGCELRGFVLRPGPDLDVYGQQTDDIILLWLKNQKFTWLHARMGIESREQSSGQLHLANIPNGVWIAEWLDTVDNRWLERSIEEARNGRMRIKTPPVQRSMVVRLFRVRSVSR